ncbi:nitronate monooxygenase [Gammaproteobacteria bacterium 45_16_T64]|nr:nitronate monooxygenase [Gammaproteobacteria bacterium 45_16_T64]
MLKTPITELLNIEHPIVQGGMQWVGRAELASAVSNAGGLGLLTALTQPTPEDLYKEINRCREMTDKPFGINLTILPTIKPVPYDEYAQAAISAGIKVIETAGRNPEKFMPMFKSSDITIIHKCTSVRHAIKAEQVGVDAISIDGFECAGHPGEDDIPGLILIPAARKAVNIPMLASGGFGTGSGLAAAIALGADGINMGTRFLATKEAPVHQNVKDRLVEASEMDTALIFRTLNNTARIYNNSVAKKVVDIESLPGETDFSDLADHVAGVKGREVLEKGDLEHGVWTAGMIAGLIDDIPDCKTLLVRIIAEAEEIITRQLASVVA